MSRSEYLLEGLDFSNIKAMDAGTGAGSTTLLLARKVAEAGGKGRIVSIDTDQTTFADVREKLAENAGLVQFVKADLTSMPEIETGSFNLVVCGATICALNDRPLKALRGLAEFYRVLKKGGRLAIGDEYPLPKPTRREEEVQVMRWQTYKAIAELIGEGHYTEIYPEELEFAASLVGFKDIEWRRVEGGPLRKETMEEWRQVMCQLVGEIGDGQARAAFLASVGRVYERFQREGGNNPPTYEMKMKK